MKNEPLFIESDIPDSLTELELNTYFSKMQNGDLEARNYIITHNIKLVFNAIHEKYAYTSFEKKDLVSIGLIGLIKSVDHFNPDLKIKFSSYATKCIDNAILAFIRKEKKYLTNYSLESPITSNINFEEGLKLLDILIDDNDDIIKDYINGEINKNLKEIIANLPERYKKIIILRFGFINDNPLTQREIAEILNTSRSNISNILPKALKKIKKELQNKDLF